MKDLEEKKTDAENRAETSQQKVSEYTDLFFGNLCVWHHLNLYSVSEQSLTTI